MLTLSEWRQKVLDNSKSCKAECHCTSEGLCTSCHEESMADVRCNECKQIVNADDSSGDSFILNTNALPRELQVQCLAETIIMMESHVGDSYKGKKFNNKKDISKKKHFLLIRTYVYLVLSACRSVSRFLLKPPDFVASVSRFSVLRG